MVRAAGSGALLLLGVAGAAAGTPGRAFRVPGPAPTHSPFGVVRDELQRALGDLTRGTPDVRQAAQRWLASHLALEHLDALASALRGAPEERRLRLVLALGSDDRHLELAALLASDPDPDTRAAGEAALRELLLRWNPGVGDPPQPPARLPEDWTERFNEPLRLDPTLGDLPFVLDRLDRLGRAPVPVVLDPSLDPVVRADPPDRLAIGDPGEATWNEHLLLLCAVHRVRFELHGYRDPGLDGARDARPWVRVCKRGEEGRAAGADLLVDWVRGVQRLHDPHWNRACAVALACTGWPAAVEWLERRWVRTGDRACLEGLLAAAERGRAAPSLADVDQVRALLSRADARLASDLPGSVAHAERLARALGAVGPTALDGRALAPVLLEGWDQLPAVSRWVRLVAAEAQGRRDRVLAERARATLVTEGDPRLRLAALECLLVVQGPDPEPCVPVAPVVLLEAGAAGGRLVATARGLAAVGARPDPRLTADSLRLEPPVRLALVEWLALVGEAQRASEFLGEGAARRVALDLLADRLREWGGLGLGDEGRALAAALEQGGDAPAARRLLLRAGLAGGLLRARVALDLTARTELDVEEALDLACLAADTHHGEAARRVLLSACADPGRAAAFLPAAARAVLELRRARQEDLCAAFELALEQAAREPGHPLARQLFGEGWPPRVPVPVLRLDALDRVWGE